MKSYLILGSQSKQADTNNIIAVRDGFSWSAALLAPLWFIWRAMWLHALLSGFTYAGLLFLISNLPYAAIFSAIALLSVALWFGYEARFFYIEYLKRSGAESLDVIMAPNTECAEEIYLAKHGVSFSQSSAKAGGVKTAKLPNLDGAPNLIFSQNWET